MSINELLLRKVMKGDPLSAREHNEIIRLLKRKITGPLVQETSTGWHIRREPSTPEVVDHVYIDEYCYVKSDDANASFGWDNSAVIKAVKAGATWIGVFKFTDRLSPFPVGETVRESLVIGERTTLNADIADTSAAWTLKIGVHRINEDFTPQTLTYNQYVALDTDVLHPTFFQIESHTLTDAAEDMLWHIIFFATCHQGFLDSMFNSEIYGVALVPSVPTGANGTSIDLTMTRALSWEAWAEWVAI